MTTLTFDAERHEELITVMRTTVTAIQDRLDALDHEVAHLQRDWDGAARDAYTTAHAQWTAEMTALHRLLTAAATATETAGHTLNRAEHAATDIWT